MFLTTREEFRTYLVEVKKPFMKTFYEKQRKRLNILVDKNKQPIGGQWSFDNNNRLSLLQKMNPLDVPLVKNSFLTNEVIEIINKNFPDHPGEAENFWLPTDRAGAIHWLKRFL